MLNQTQKIALVRIPRALHFDEESRQWPGLGQEAGWFYVRLRSNSRILGTSQIEGVDTRVQGCRDEKGGTKVGAQITRGARPPDHRRQ
jgi:hypothetical protein